MKNLLHRFSAMGAFIVAAAVFMWNMHESGDLGYAAFWALCVFLGLSVVLLLAVQGMAHVLYTHLSEKRREQALLALQEEQKKKAATAKQQ